jgi:transcriptional regulator with XRE-family HTH domain
MERIDRGLKQAELSVMLGVAYQTIERWEHSRTPITPRNRAKIPAFPGEKPRRK